MIYSDDNIHTALEKLAASGLDKTAVSADYVRAAIKKRMAGVQKGKLRGMFVGHEPAAEATSAQLRRLREITKARKAATQSAANNPDLISRPGGMKKLKAHNRAKNVDTAVSDGQKRSRVIANNRSMWRF
tara:strand:- start:66 stop:455 length:390 start_codon:yes stop_codon:yes gene_type:complete